MPTKIISGEKIMDQLIDDLMSVDAGSHTNSQKFSDLEIALKDLCDTIQSLRAGNDENGEDKILTEEVTADLRQKYSTAIRYCAEYTDKLFDRRSGFGEGRLQCARELQKLLTSDYDALKAYNPAEKKNLNHIFFMSRTQEVTLDVPPEELVTVGANSSVRIPLAITTEIGTEKGFFTEDYTHLSREEILTKVREDHVTEENGLAPFMELFYKQDDNGERTADAVRFKNFLDDFTALRKTLRERGRSYDDLAGDKALFDELIVPIVKKMWTDGDRDVFLEDLDSDPAFKQRFLDLMQDLGIMANERSMARAGKIEEGQNIPARNVGMSRVADMMGMGNLIAKAKKISLKDKDGNVRTGVFQEAEEFSDYSHPKQGDLLYDITDNPEILDDPKILKQIADLQVLDYICGNNDRHLGNIMFNVQKINGKTVLLGLKGIDNDRSFGLATMKDISEFGFAVPPRMMAAISQSAYDAIKELTPEKLRIALADLGISGEAITAMMNRVNDIRAAVSSYKLKVLSDAEFAVKDIEDLFRGRKIKVGEKEEYRHNLYTLFKGMPKNIQKHQPDPSGPLKYNAARATTEPLFRRDDRTPIRLADLSQQKTELLRAVQKLKDADSSVFRNSGSFKWVQSALDSAVNNITRMEKAYESQQGAALSEEDAEVIDKCFRQIRLACGKYYSSHRNPFMPWGKARKSCAESLMNIWPLRIAEQEAPVREINIDNINLPGIRQEAAEDHQEAPARKPVKGIRQTIRDAKRTKASEGMTNRRG